MSNYLDLISFIRHFMSSKTSNYSFRFHQGLALKSYPLKNFNPHFYMTTFVIDQILLDFLYIISVTEFQLSDFYYS